MVLAKTNCSSSKPERSSRSSRSVPRTVTRS